MKRNPFAAGDTISAMWTTAAGYGVTYLLQAEIDTSNTSEQRNNLHAERFDYLS
jgi:hypothetical protein